MNGLHKSGCRNSPATDLIELLTLAKQYYNRDSNMVDQKSMLQACVRVSQKDYLGVPIRLPLQITHAVQLVKLSEEAQNLFLKELLTNLSNSKLRPSLLKNVEIHTIQNYTAPTHYSWPEVNYFNTVIENRGKRITKEMGIQLVVDFTIAAVVYKYVTEHEVFLSNPTSPEVISFLEKLQNLELKGMKGYVKKADLKGVDKLVYPNKIPSLLVKEVSSFLKELGGTAADPIHSDNPGEAFVLKEVTIGDQGEKETFAHYFIDYKFGSNDEDSVAERFANARELTKDVVSNPVNAKLDFIFINPPWGVDQDLPHDQFMTKAALNELFKTAFDMLDDHGTMYCLHSTRPGFADNNYNNQIVDAILNVSGDSGVFFFP